MLTQKYTDFLLFKQAFEIIKNKEHLIHDPSSSEINISKSEPLSEGSSFFKLIKIRANINRGMTDILKEAFPRIDELDTLNVEGGELKKLIVSSQKDISNSWLAGFTSAEGCFSVKAIKSKAYKAGYNVKLVFQLTQHERDISLMEAIIKKLGCGRIIIRSNVSWVDIEVVKLSDIYNIIIPLFKENPIRGVKAYDFKDFVKVANLMNNKEHLTIKGVETIKQIKENMNRGRSY